MIEGIGTLIDNTGQLKQEMYKKGKKKYWIVIRFYKNFYLYNFY
jgi:hypothetical protein